MEKYKNQLILERLIIHDSINEWREWLFLLINMDYNISEQTQALAKIIYLWPGKLNKALEVSDKRHFEDRESIEGEMFKRRDVFEREMFLFEFDIKVIESYDDLFSYPTYIIPIRDFNTKFEEMKERKNKLEYEENILLGYKSLYESYFRVEKFFEPHYLLWSTAEKFVDTKKLWRGLAASTICIDEVVKLKNNCQNVLRKLKGKFGTNQNQVIDSLNRQIKDLDSWMPIIENLSNPGLKDLHWDQINKEIGAEIDFKKISIEKIKFMKIEHLLDPIFKISEVASHEYSIELYIRQMGIELDKHFEKIENISNFKLGDLVELKLSQDFITEQQSNLNTLRSNKYIERLLSLLEQHEARLHSLAELISTRSN